MHLSRFAKVDLCHQPTPLQPMPALSKALGGPDLFIKRDDCTGLATGGNKTRKLEYLMADVLAQGADTVITQGAVQSNHARQTAAAAAKLGLGCEVLLERRVADRDPDYEHSGNVLLDRLLRARIHYHPEGSDMDNAMEELAERLRAEGAKPYIIPGGGLSSIGALGYVSAALELIYQANQRGLRIDHIVHATGSGGTQAGLLAGLAGLNAGVPVHGVSVRHPRGRQENSVHELAEETAALVGVRGGVPRETVMVEEDYVGGGYGQPTPEMVEAVELLAATEGVLLDPVYTGKAMAGLIGLVRQGMFKNTDNVVFLHTGGAVALFAYPSSFSGRHRSWAGDAALGRL